MSLLRTVLDWETAYGKHPVTQENITLSKMTTEEYVRHALFKAHGLGVKIDQDPAFYVYGSDLITFLKTHPWERTFAVAHHCLPGDVEVLTPQGWKPIKEATCADQIMQWDPRTEQLSWACPSYKTEAHTDELYVWDTSFHRCGYSSKHRMLFNTPDVAEWRSAPTDEIAQKSMNNTYIPVAGVYDALQELDVTPAEARFLEATRADGSIGASCNVRFKLSKVRKIERLQRMLTAMGLSFSTRQYTNHVSVVVHKHPVTEKVCALLGPKKEYGPWVMNLSRSARYALLREALHWDGSVRAASKTAYQFSTVSEATADAFQLMAHLSGWSISGSWRDNNRGLGSGNNKPLFTASIRNRHRVKLVEKPTIIHGECDVYCFTVPTGAFMVRSHGRVHITGNSHFDGAIFSWRARIRPAFWGCTLSMARAVFPHESASLANIARLLNIGEKGVELANFSGKWDLTAEEQRVLGGYCKNDVELTSLAFDALKHHFPVSELRLIDLTVRLFTEPVLQVERGVLLEEYKRERRSKRALLKACATDKSVLASNDQFAQLLLSLGVDPPKKVSPSKVKDGRVDKDSVGEPPLGILPSFKPLPVHSAEDRDRLKAEKNVYPWAYAFGKNDEAFKMLLEHPDPQVQAVVEARMGVKSTIKETRSKRFYQIGSRGAFPMYLSYYAARTGRWGGGDKVNVQNLTRVNPKDVASGALRRSLLAPPGHILVVRDLGQIEARVLAYWAGQEDLLDLFRNGGDPYNRQASLIFGYEVNRKLDQFWLEGLVGKASTLGNGYGMSWAKFQESLRVGFMGMPSLLFNAEAAQKLGADIDVFCHSRSWKKGCAFLREEALAMKPLNVEEEAHLWHCAAVKQIVDKYREGNDAIVAGWKEAGQALKLIENGIEGVPVGKRNLITTCREGLLLPNGMKIQYHKLRSNDSGEMRYLSNRRKNEWSYLYGGKCVENLTQALARIVLSDQMLNIHNWCVRQRKDDPSMMYTVVTSTHDEVVCCVPRYRADECLEMMKIEMATAPAWCADLPLKSSGGYAISYGDCEK